MHLQVKWHFKVIQIKFTREELKEWKKEKNWKGKLLLKEVLPSVQETVDAFLVEYREKDSVMPPRIIVVEPDSTLLYIMFLKRQRLPRHATQSMLIPIRGLQEFKAELLSKDREKRRTPLLFLTLLENIRNILLTGEPNHAN